MYNLFVTANEENWEGKPFYIDISRVYAGSNAETGRKFKDLTGPEINELTKLPCIFAYEGKVKKTPKFGRITEVKKRDTTIRIDYEIIHVNPFLTWEELAEQAFNWVSPVNLHWSIHTGLQKM